MDVLQFSYVRVRVRAYVRIWPPYSPNSKFLQFSVWSAIVRDTYQHHHNIKNLLKTAILKIIAYKDHLI